ncbi:MAG TPA: cob(I)yrinic acid a,c-diamide adenosyltransferase [Tepidisphaeraceae bacterium]|nr:cob(I)yrinic acid a,c-diamide adenosyltransferase [Tepidisphaeraceae bacterium]
MKIYTKKGDDGSTGLLGGQRLRKCEHRLECTGTVDELNAALGLAAIALHRDTAELIQPIQNELFVIGSLLGSARPQPDLPRLEETSIKRLEQQIDAAEAQLSPLANFILPGGTEAAARLHVARTICRRAERNVVEFAEKNPVPPAVIAYLNRLSDWLFVQARFANHHEGVPDVIWTR